MVEESFAFLEDNRVAVRPEHDEFSESVAEFMQRNKMKARILNTRVIVYKRQNTVYRVTQKVSDLGWVDLDLECYTSLLGSK